MKLFLKIIIPLVAIVQPSYGQTNSAFPNLNKVVIDTAFHKVIFGYENKTTKLLRKPCKDLPKNDPWYCEHYDEGEISEKVAVYSNDLIPDSLEIIFSPGLSDDPSFIIYKKKSDKIIGEIGSTEIYLTSAGTVYTAGHTNSMFNIRRKFQLSQDTLIEIKQQYHYVGLKSKTQAPLTLYQNKTGNEIVAQLPAGYEVEVLLCDMESTNSQKLYLIRTDFGLVGWLRLGSDATYETPIKGLYFAGD